MDMSPLDPAVNQWAAQYGLWCLALVRLLIAAAVGATIGMEREWRGRNAGLRTNLLLAVAGAMVMILSIHMVGQDWTKGQNVQLRMDLVGVVQAVMVGMGFMGSGIIKSGKEKGGGLTTAAGAWTVAVLGLAAGLGMVTLCIMGVAIVLIALRVLEWLEQKFLTRQMRTVTVRGPWAIGAPREAVRQLQAAQVEVTGHRFERVEDLRTVQVQVEVSLRPGQDEAQVAEVLSGHGWEVVGVG